MHEEEKNLKKIDRTYVKKSRIKRRILKRVWVVRALLLAGFAALLFLFFFALGQIFGKLKVADYFNFAKNFLFTPQGVLQEHKGRTNVLVLGKAGKDHEAPDLTDTMLFASISSENKDLVLLSLPRDIWVPEIRAKLNSAYYWGNQKEEGGGLVLAKAISEEVVGQPIHYALVVDFSVFKGLVNVLGGVEVEVDNSFVDEKFPIFGKENDDCDGDPLFLCRYETVSFEKGVQLMDGETALKFARSRNAEGDEGTDIARSKRQQKIISAIKNKVFSLDTLFSFSKIKKMARILEENIETDITINASAALLRRVFQTRNRIVNRVIPEEFLLNPPASSLYDNLYVFIPAGGSWDSFYVWVQELLD